MNTKVTLFFKLSIIIIYCISLNELVFTDQYNTRMNTLNDKWNKKYYAIDNKYRIAMGEDNPSIVKAQEHFTKTFIPKMFSKCSHGYFGVLRFLNKQYIPPTYNKWYQILYKDGTYKYYPTYKVIGFSEFGYQETRIEKQTDSEIKVYLSLIGNHISDKKWYKVGGFYVYLDYSFAPIRVEAVDDTDSLPFFGEGIKPINYSCDFLTSKNGMTIDQ